MPNAISFLFALTMSALALAAGNQPPQVGEVFPDLRFPVLGEGRLGAISDYRGTKVLLIQFASW